MVFLQVVLSFHDMIVRMSLISIHNFKTKQGDFNCGASSQADFILNHFLSNFLSNSPFPPRPAGMLEQFKPPLNQVFIYIDWTLTSHVSACLPTISIISAQTFLTMRTGKNAVKAIKKNQEKCGWNLVQGRKGQYIEVHRGQNLHSGQSNPALCGWYSAVHRRSEKTKLCWDLFSVIRMFVGLDAKTEKERCA